MSSMEDNWSWRTPAITLVAPVAWGSTYVVTENLLPPDRPLFAAVVRALPVGLAIVVARRRLPRGSWWWRSLVLGTCNMGLFFALLFTAAYRLPGGIASTVTAMSPLAVMLLAAAMIRERPSVAGLAGGVVGVAGVGLLVLRSDAAIDPVGLLAAIGAVLVSGLGFVLLKRWERPVDLITLTGWQLTAAGLVLLPVALVVEGAPPHVSGTNVAGFVWLGVVGTGLAYVCWFHGLTHMTAGAAALLGLVNPVVGTTLGVVVMREGFGPAQLLGVLLVLGGVLAGQPAAVRLIGRRLSHVAPTVESCATASSRPTS
jgi:probable blue pigment (indigoidine) exporter